MSEKEKCFPRLTRTKGSIKAVLQKRNRVMNRAIVLEVLIYIFKYKKLYYTCYHCSLVHY